MQPAALLAALLLCASARASPYRVVVALSEAQAPALMRVFNRSLANATRASDVALEPLLLTWPESPTFSAKTLQDACDAIESQRVAAMLLLGDDPSARAIAMAADAAGIPLLWARGTVAPGFFQQEIAPLEVPLGPTPRDLMEAVRALLLAAHWHSFTVLADASVLLGRELYDILKAPPLSPTLNLMRPDAPPQAIFRRLADISRATRGVVLLVCDASAAKRVSAEARRLNMMSGHFVWLWLDTGGELASNTTTPAAERYFDDDDDEDEELPVGLLALRPAALLPDRPLVRAAARLFVDALSGVTAHCEGDGDPPTPAPTPTPVSCWDSQAARNFSKAFTRELREVTASALAGRRPEEKALTAQFHLLNLVAAAEETSWRQTGQVSGRAVRLDSIVWPGGDLVVSGLSGRTRSVFRVVTALAPPFVMEGELDEDGQCLRGLPCHRVPTSGKDNLTLVFNDMDTMERADDDARDNASGRQYVDSSSQQFRYRTSCCYGLAMDLLENVAQELEFDFHLYVVPDGMFGTRSGNAWNGVVGDLVSGAAHMSFAALSVSSARSEVIDFSVPYFFSGVSFLAAPTQRSEVPLLAFLLPFSPELWIAIFTSLNITAMAVAVYEWLSPFGLNPWGRQRSKNFSIASALWVMWGLLCGHLVAFKAPKSWPNKFLINVWGGFSVIFVASYTANIAALIAGLFFHNAVSNYHDRSLLSQRVGAPRASAAEYYVQRANHLLWQHMQRFSVRDVEHGIQLLKNGTLDILIADTPILDYYRATDHGCKLQKIGDAINEDTYAVGMAKGFPLKDSISAVISKYASNGYMDILQEKWYGALPCFKLATDMAQPRPLGVAAVAGVFILLGVGMVLGCLILLFEHLFYRYTLPILRHKPKGTIWRSRNIMFFSQKLYRFINCVELVSPHHAARELVHTLRQGQITSLFQKSVKRKEHEQRRRRKSKAQFFEMIQEIRRVQQEERDVPETTPNPQHLGGGGGVAGEGTLKPSPHLRRPLLSPSLLRPKVPSPRGGGKGRRYSTDMVLASSAVGRRLSKDWAHSPPDINSRRASNLDVRQHKPGPVEQLNASPVRECASATNVSQQQQRRPYSATWAHENPSVGARLGGSSSSLGRRRVRSETGSSRSRSLESEDARPRPKKADFVPYESIIEVNVTCCDALPVDEEPPPAATPAAPALLSPRSLQEPARRSPRRSNPADSSLELSTSSMSLSPLHQELEEEVFDDIPPPPPPPSCNTRNSSGGSSPLERLERDELVALWRSSESELRSQLLRAIRSKEPP